MTNLARWYPSVGWLVEEGAITGAHEEADDKTESCHLRTMQTARSYREPLDP